MLSKQIEKKILNELEGAKVTIIDFSEEHEGHHAPGAHVALTVVHESFEDLSLPEQHQVIYKILEEELKNDTIHALRIRTKVKEDG